MLSFFGRNTPCKRQAQCYYTNWKTTTLRVLLLVEFFLLLTTTANAASSSSTTRTSEHHHHHHRLEYIHRVPCPTDKSLLGYTSIESLNLEIKRHKSLVVPPILSPPHAQYTYRLCPHTRYLDASTTSLTPFLDHTHILCGRNGDVNDHCVLEGDGSGPQVLLVDTLPIQPRVVVLEGITFEQTTTTASTTTASGYSEHYSIAAVASNQMRAEFLHCHWKNAQRVLLISHAISVAVPFQNPDVTFAFDTTMNNIFDHRRRRRRRSAELSQEQDILDDGRLVEYSPTKSMSVSLLDCIIEVRRINQSINRTVPSRILTD